ncbi:hypothetical protein [Ferrigenium sp. UT5]|uniref:hypothetical protein n=1 Tax=Ferrigenium sp. UT5 TaxID=3242105 RepID=UPI0038B2A212
MNTSEPFPAPDLQRFALSQCDALFAAVLVHDDLYPEARLPDVIQLNYSRQQLATCYYLCRQLWLEGVERRALQEMIVAIQARHALPPEQQLAFKYVRAKFKHLRFAFVACDERHRYPLVFHWLTGIMGNLQDAVKNKHGGAVRRAALVSRLLLSRLPFALLTREINRFQPSTTASFRRYVQQQIAFISGHLSREKVTSKEFHEMRKVISRLVALYDNLKILFPSPDHDSISRYLSTLNGLMGSYHDELISKKFTGSHDYYADAFAIPADIRLRLGVMTEKFARAE